MVYQAVQQSAVLKPSATLGVVARGPKVSMVRLGSEHFVTASVGCSFHIYDCSDLQLQYLSRPLSREIGCVLAIGECSAVTQGSEILLFHKMTVLAALKGHTAPVEHLANLGDSFLVSVAGSEVFVWQLPNLSRQMHALTKPLTPVRKLSLTFKVSTLAPIPTYVNKMLFGGANGELELWNINKSEKLYTFTCQGAVNSSVSAIAAAPVLDVAAVGFEDGSIVVLNLKSDELIMSLNQKAHGGVSALSFRQDSVGGQLVSGSTKGDLVVWDLNKRVIHSFHSGVHPGGVGTAVFLDTLPLLLTAGIADNAISAHIFDKPDGGCRLLRERRGFTQDLNYLLSYGEHDLVVAGQEVGKLNLIQSQQNQVWSQKALHSQTSGKDSRMPWRFRNMATLPEVVSVSNCQERIRHFDWPTVVTAHAGLPDAYVWSNHQQALVNRMLIIPRQGTTGSTPSAVCQVAVSPCGNYAVLGLENGELHRFNLQSCYYRGLVGKLDSAPVALKFLSPRELVSADLSGVKTWRVVPRPQLVSTLTSVSDVARISVNGFLCAVAHTSSHTVSVVDMHADRKARTVPVTAPVTALSWSNGGKWLVIATADAKCVVYDMPTAAVVDRVQFSSVCLDAIFTENNGYLVTAHEGGKGAIRVWQNVALLNGPGMMRKGFYPIDAPMDAPDADGEIERTPVGPAVSIAMIDGEFQLSDGPRTRWQQILKLDEIKERNRPMKPAERPKSAPFFLPVRYQGVEPVFVAPEEDDIVATEPEVKRQKSEGGESGLLKMIAKRNFRALRDHLIAQTASGVHICLAELEDGGDEAICGFIDFLAAETESGCNLDLVATWVALFVKVYGQTVRGRATFGENMERLALAVKAANARFEQETNQLQCLLKVTAALQLHR